MPLKINSDQILKQSLIVLFLVLITGLGIRSLITEDARFGWGMFAHWVKYRVEFEWRFADGRTVPHKPADDLSGEPLFWLGAGLHESFNGLGEAKSWVQGYLRDASKTDPPTEAAALTAYLTYYKNGETQARHLSLSHPVEGA